MEDVRRELLDGADELEPGVVDEDVGAGCRGLRGVEVGEVQELRFDDAGETVGLLDQRLQSVTGPVDGSDTGPRGGEPERAGPADAAGRAGDERRAAGEVEHDGAGRGRGGGCGALCERCRYLCRGGT